MENKNLLDSTKQILTFMLLPLILNCCAPTAPKIIEGTDLDSIRSKSFIYGRIDGEKYRGYTINLLNLKTNKWTTYKFSKLMGPLEMWESDFLFVIEPGNWELRSVSTIVKDLNWSNGKNMKFNAEPGIGYYVGDFQKDSIDAEMKMAYPGFLPGKTIDLKTKFSNQ